MKSLPTANLIRTAHEICNLTSFSSELFSSDPLVHLAVQVNCLLVSASACDATLKGTWLQIQMLISSEAQEVKMHETRMLVVTIYMQGY